MFLGLFPLWLNKMAIPSTNLSEELDSLKNVLRQRGYPIDKYKNHSYLLPLTPAEPPDPKFKKLLDELYRQTVGSRRKAFAEELKRQWVYFLLGLSGSALTHKWLTVSLTKSTYSRINSGHKNDNLAYDAINIIVEYLKEEELALVLWGGQNKSGPNLTRVYPTPGFAALILPFYLSSSESFDSNHFQVTINEREHVDTINLGEEVKGLPKLHPDRKDLETINSFLKKQKWACRGPILLKYKNSPLNGGGLYTRYQELPDKNHRIRINTLINEEPIYELVFNANHLRLAMAVLHKQDIGETPYEDIMWIADIKDRALVRSFVTIAIWARNRDQAHSRWKLNSNDTGTFFKIENALKKRFPELKLYNDWSRQAQDIEGAILRDIMLAGIEKDVPVLPVNNAIAIQQRHESWAVESMLESWDKHVDYGRTRLKVSRP